jgi:hypothetical protein
VPTKHAHTLSCPTNCSEKLIPWLVHEGVVPYLVEAARTEVQRQKLLQFLEGKAPAGREPAWRDSDIPNWPQAFGFESCA